MAAQWPHAAALQLGFFDPWMDEGLLTEVIIFGIDQGGLKMDFGGTPGSKYDFTRNASSFFYS